VSVGDKENFLARWSRRKVDAAREAPAPKPAAPSAAPPAAPAAAPVKPDLPPIDTLKGLASEYREFLRPGVDEKLRQSALKKLFRDPHFNVMDGLDVYIDDYSKPDPIPEAMLRTLSHAKSLLFNEEKKEEPQAGEKSAPAPLPEAPPVAEAKAVPVEPVEKKDKA
jgi:uncharacterized protein DUF3306